MAIIRTYGQGHGNVRGQLKNQDTRIVKGYSAVFSAVREWTGIPGEGGYGYIAAAKLTICNLDPGDGCINYWLDIDWHTDIAFELTFVVM